MATSKPMLGDLELQQVQKIEIDEDQALAQQSVPALEGDFLQRLGRRATQIGLTGVLTGDAAGAGLKTLQEKFRAAEPVSFVADIATATKVDQVLIEELGMRELAGRPQRFEYALTLREYTPPPKPEPPAPQPPPPEPPSVDTGKLVVDVTVTGQPGFDFSTITVSVAGTQDDGTQLNRTITQRSENTWTDDQMPPGQYTVTAMESDAQSLSGSASATIQVGQTTQVSITLTPATNIAQTFIVHYRIDKAFIEPAMRQVLKQVADYAQAHTDEKLLIVGHTDLTRNPSIPNYNQSLSERRARGVYAYLTFGGDVELSAAALDEWNALRLKRPAGEDPSIKDSWDVHEYQHILQDLGFYPGNVDGIDGPLTQNAVSAYRCKKGLPPGTTVDDQTWEALIEDYLSQEPLSIPESQFLPNCGNEILKWLGCGEKDPVKNISSAWRPNRRTELLFVRADKLPCEVTQPVTFDLPTKGTVNSDWCVGGNAAQLTCFVTPAKDACSSGSATSWCRQPAEPGTLTVQGSIKREQADGSFVPVANQKFVLIVPDGQFKAGEQSNGEPQAARTGKDGTFTFSNLRVGIYSLEVIAPVLVRLAEDSDASSNGNAVVKHLSSDTDRLDVVIVNAPNLREITLPVAAHLMTALHPLTREVRTCPAAGGGTPLLQATAHTDDDIRTAFATANDIWQQARIQFNLTDIVREAYAFRTDCEIDQSEFQIILERCAYPGAVNVFFVGDLAGTGEAGGTISPEDGASLNIAGCSVGDRFQAIILGFPQDISLVAQQTAQVLAHELGHYLNLPHVDETPANANRLMLASTQDGSNRTLIQDEVNSARSSKGASDNCVPLSLDVVVAKQIGGTLSNKYLVLQVASVVVTVFASIPDSLLDPSRGTLTMTGGIPGADNSQQTVSAAHKGIVPVTATYTPAGGGTPVTESVEIRVATYTLAPTDTTTVDGAKHTGEANSTTYVATRDPRKVITIKATIDPELFCVPSNLVKWTGGSAVADPVLHTVSRASYSTTLVKAKINDVEFTNTIIISDARLVKNNSPFDTPVSKVEIEGLLDKQFNLPGKKIALSDLFAFQTASLFRASVPGASASSTTNSATLISLAPDGRTEVDRLALNLTHSAGDILLSQPVLAVPAAFTKDELKKITLTDFTVIRTLAGGKLRLLQAAADATPADAYEAVVSGRVLYIFAQTFTNAKVTAKDLNATTADIGQQIQNANHLWAQIGLEVKTRKIQDSVPDPSNLLTIVDKGDGEYTPSERILLGLDPGGPSYSSISTDLNVFYVQKILDPRSTSTGEDDGLSFPGQPVTALAPGANNKPALSHEIGHHILNKWPGRDSHGKQDDHVDLTGKDWPDTNVMYRSDVSSAKDVDITQAQNILDGITQGENKVVVFEPAETK